jgi:hypothetical protein
MEFLTALSDIVLNLPFLLILVGILFVVYWVNAFFLMYHLVRFGIGPRPKLLALIFFIGSIVLFAGATYASSTMRLEDFILVIRSYIQQVPLPSPSF